MYPHLCLKPCHVTFPWAHSISNFIIVLSGNENCKIIQLNKKKILETNNSFKNDFGVEKVNLKLYNTIKSQVL